MGTKGGIWLDQKGAWLVTGAGDNASIEHLDSGVNDLHLATGGTRGARAFVHRSVSSAAHDAKRHENELQSFFSTLVPRIGGCDELVVMGSGPVKDAFVSHLETHGLGNKITATIKCPRLTENQLKAKINSYFGYKPQRGRPEQHA